MKRILVIHGPNLQLLGQRETDIYGDLTLDHINSLLTEQAQLNDIALSFFQSNHEGEIVDKIGKAKQELFDVIIINPAAYTHTSVAIRDAIAGIKIPTIEVHLSNIYAREEFRHTSLIAPVSFGQISGFGADGYLLAFNAALKIIKETA